MNGRNLSTYCNTSMYIIHNLLTITMKEKKALDIKIVEEA